MVTHTAISIKIQPSQKTMRTGLTEKDVIPSMAKFNIFLNGYFDSPAKRLSPIIVNTGGLVTDERHQPAQIEIALAETAKLLDSTATHQAIIRMVINRLYSHYFHQLVESEGSGTFEESVGFTFPAYTINNVTSLSVAFEHFGNGVDVILQVGIYGNGDITSFFDGIQSGHECIWCPTFPARFSPQA